MLVPPPRAATRRRYAVGSHALMVCSPMPGTSGEKRAVARADWPGRSVTRVALSAPGNAARMFVASAPP